LPVSELYDQSSAVLSAIVQDLLPEAEVAADFPRAHKILTKVGVGVQRPIAADMQQSVTMFDFVANPWRR